MHVRIANQRGREKCSWHSQRMRNSQFYVSGKRPHTCVTCYIKGEITNDLRRTWNHGLVTCCYLFAEMGVYVKTDNVIVYHITSVGITTKLGYNSWRAGFRSNMWAWAYNYAWTGSTNKRRCYIRNVFSSASGLPQGTVYWELRPWNTVYNS